MLGAAGGGGLQSQAESEAPRACRNENSAAIRDVFMHSVGHSSGMFDWWAQKRW